MFKKGDMIDCYRLTELLGSGAYGTVFAACNTVSQQRCALKIVPLCGRAGGRELRALRQYHGIDHPNLLKIHHSGTVGDNLYYTMELADGKLAGQHLSPSALRAAGAKLAGALAALHEHGLLHRDIKPDNLFWLNGEPLIGDIGLMTADCGASLTGTPGFLLPEVQQGGAALSERSDLYALAKTLYCLLSGYPPCDYPKYSGSVDADASILMQAVLSVCDDDGGITSAAELRAFLLTAKPQKKRRRARLAAIGIGFAALVALICGIYVCFPELQRCFFSRYEQMAYAVYEAEYVSPAEQLAIARQQKVFADLQNEAARQAGMTGKKVTVRTIEMFVRNCDKLTAEMVRARTEQSPEFHCFFVLYNDAREFSKPLLWAFSHPERGEVAEKDFALWQRKRSEYCRMRDTLLKESEINDKGKRAWSRSITQKLRTMKLKNSGRR